MDTTSSAVSVQHVIFTHDNFHLGEKIQLNGYLTIGENHE